MAGLAMTHYERAVGISLNVERLSIDFTKLCRLPNVVQISAELLFTKVERNSTIVFLADCVSDCLTVLRWQKFNNKICFEVKSQIQVSIELSARVYVENWKVCHCFHLLRNRCDRFSLEPCQKKNNNNNNNNNLTNITHILPRIC